MHLMRLRQRANLIEKLSEEQKRHKEAHFLKCASFFTETPVKESFGLGRGAEWFHKIEHNLKAFILDNFGKDDYLLLKGGD